MTNHDYLQEFEVQQLQAAVKETDTASLVLMLMLCTGARPGEIARLTWKDVDLSDGVLVIKHGKSVGQRVVPCTDMLADVLKRRRCQAIACNKYDKKSLVVGRHGICRAAKVLKQAARNLKISIQPGRALRNTAILNLVKAGATIDELNAALGYNIRVGLARTNAAKVKPCLARLRTLFNAACAFPHSGGN